MKKIAVIIGILALWGIAALVFSKGPKKIEPALDASVAEVSRPDNASGIDGSMQIDVRLNSPPDAASAN